MGIVGVIYRDLLQKERAEGIDLTIGNLAFH